MIEIVPSGRIDYCCYCDSEHGYECPLYNIGKNYHFLCELLDKEVCTGWSERDKCVMPATAEEFGQVQKNARFCRGLMYLSGRRKYSREQIDKAIQDAA